MPRCSCQIGSTPAECHHNLYPSRAYLVLFPCSTNSGTIRAEELLRPSHVVTMTTQFGWFDTLHALSTCLACTIASSSTDSLHNYAHNPPRECSTSSGSGSRAPHGQTNRFPSNGLLLEDSTDDEYADTVSLHSNVGITGQRITGREEAMVSARKKPSASKSKRRGKEGRRDDGWFTIFGYDLFGKRKGAIQLPLTDDEDEEDADRSAGRMSRTRSGSTLDSDAAPLDDAAIAAISQAHTDDQDYDGGRDRQDTAEEVAAKIREQAEKERRQKRKERRALERALAAGSSFNSHEDGEFEGFQGSGAGVLVPRREKLLHSSSSRSTGTSITLKEGDADDEEALADQGGSIYTRITTGVPAAGGPESRSTTSTNMGSNSSSDSRRHRSRSHAHETAEQFHEDMATNFALQSPVGSQNSVNDKTKKKKVHAHRIKPTHASSSSVAASDSTRSASLPSPTGSMSLGPGLSFSLSPSHPQSASPAQVSQQPNRTRKDEKTKTSAPSFHNGFAAGGLVYDGENRGFPSVGFGRVGRGNGDSLSNGAFLARRGDE